MKVIEITTHKAVAWSFKEEQIMRNLVRQFGSHINRLHNIAYHTFPYRERQSVRRKVYRVRMDRDYINTVNNIRQELLGV